MTAPISCIPRSLPRARWVEAARNAVKINPANRPEGLDADLVENEEGKKLAVMINKWWGPEVRLTVGFLDSAPADLRRRIIDHMNAWSLEANVRFVETSVDPIVRVARSSAPGTDGYWSYLGTDVLLIERDQPTMNLEGFTMATPDSEFHRVVRHEAGHTLGFPHEHMRQELVARLDRQRVIAAYMASQGWSEREVIDQVLTPLEESSIFGTAQSDETSIMCYQIDGSLTLDGAPISGGRDINPLDHAFAAAVYPR